MNEHLRSQIREVLQEEMASSTISSSLARAPLSRPSAQQLIHRTRDMINTSASSAISQFSQLVPTRSTPNHRDRLSLSASKKRKVAEAKVTTHELQILNPYVLDETNQGETASEYALEDSAILVKQVLLNL